MSPESTANAPLSEDLCAFRYAFMAAGSTDSAAPVAISVTW